MNIASSNARLNLGIEPTTLTAKDPALNDIWAATACASSALYSPVPIARSYACWYVCSTAPPKAKDKSVERAPSFAFLLNIAFITSGPSAFTETSSITLIAAFVATLPYIPPNIRGTTSSTNSLPINSVAKVVG